MVDFSNDSTVAAPPSALLKILVIEQRDYCIQAMKKVRMLEIQGIEAPVARMCAEIESLFYYCCDLLKRKMEAEAFKNLEALAVSGNPDKCRAAFRVINDYLDRIKLTAFDTRQEYDKTDPEAENTFYSEG